LAVRALGMSAKKGLSSLMSPDSAARSLACTSSAVRRVMAASLMRMASSLEAPELDEHRGGEGRGVGAGREEEGGGGGCVRS
jgi:hypothetical protein